MFKVILYMAMSANGIIAGTNNEEDFLSEYNWKILCQLSKEYGCFVWGRKTYEIVSKWDPKYFTEDIKNAHKIIISTKDINLPKGYIQAKSPKEALEILQRLGHSTVVVTGGSILNSSFAEDSLIDEIILNIDGVIIGQGIPLFNPDNFHLNLKRLEVSTFEENGVTIRYQVIKK